MRGDAGRCGEVWGGVGRGEEMRGGVGRCGEVWGGVGRCGEVRGDMGRYGEIWIYIPRLDSERWGDGGEANLGVISARSRRDLGAISA